MTKEDKLESLRYRPTKYELALDGKILAGYTRRSKMGILTMLRKNGESWAKRLNADDRITFDKSGQYANLGKYQIKVTGRTQRDAIIEGELPWFEDAIPVN